MNHIRSSSTAETCAQTYSFLPCTTTALGNLFLVLAYGFLVGAASSQRHLLLPHNLSLSWFCLTQKLTLVRRTQHRHTPTHTLHQGAAQELCREHPLLGEHAVLHFSTGSHRLLSLTQSRIYIQGPGTHAHACTHTQLGHHYLPALTPRPTLLAPRLTTCANHGLNSIHPYGSASTCDQSQLHACMNYLLNILSARTQQTHACTATPTN